MPSTPDRHRRRRLSLRGEARLSGDKLTQAQVDLLMSKIAETPSGCWEWTATRNAAGYGVIVWGTKCYKPHRLIYEWASGAPVADGLEVDHLCRCRGCCNPAHLEAVTKAENLRRRQCRDAAPLPFAWRLARDAALNLAHLMSIEAES